MVSVARLSQQCFNQLAGSGVLLSRGKELTMNKKRAAGVVLLTLAITCLALGQGDLGQPKPGPEYKQLGGLVGNWTSEGAWIDSPFSPAETQLLTVRCTWLPGGFAIERHLDGMKSLSGEDHELQVLTYDPMAKEYLSHWFDNHGGSGVHRVSISDNVLTATAEVMAQGKIYQIRGTMTGLGTDRLSYVQEYSEDGKVWTQYFHSTGTRVKQALLAINPHIAH